MLEPRYCLRLRRGEGEAVTYTTEEMFLKVELAGRGAVCFHGLENL
jgi:hypothetical protein